MNDLVGSVYKITNTINGKVYIGQTVQPLHRRWVQHRSVSSNCPKLKNAIQHYGEEAFKMELLKTVSASTKEARNQQLDYWEKSLTRL